MNQDRDLAAALREAVAGLPVKPAPVDTVVSLGRKMRRRHQVALSAALAAVVVIPTSVAVAFSSCHSRVSTVPAVSAAASAPVRVMQSGERVPLDQTSTLWLTDEGVFLAAPQSSGTSHTTLRRAAEVPSGRLSATTSGDSTGTLCVGIYRGPGRAVRVTISIGSTTLNARVLTLAGSPGWAAFYANRIQSSTSDRTAPLSITVRASDGTVLAAFTKPA